MLAIALLLWLAVNLAAVVWFALLAVVRHRETVAHPNRARHPQRPRRLGSVGRALPW
jgi:hypothetical protein